MSTISNISSGSSNGWAQLSAARAANQSKMQDKLLSKVDADGNGSVDSSELQTALDTISKKTGLSFSSAADLLTKADSNQDGTLGAAELDQALQSVLPPPPSTMDFAQSRASSDGTNGRAGDDLFAKVDADGSGGIDKNELNALMEAMGAGGSAGASSTANSAEQFASLDTDGDGSLSLAEFDASRPTAGRVGRGATGDATAASAATGAAGAAAGPRGPGGMPPPPAGGGATDDSTTYDPLDTNKDGVVSALELAAGKAAGADTTDPLTALFKAVDTDGDQKLSVSETDALAKQVTTALETMQNAAATANADGSTSGNGDDKPVDLRALAQLVLKQYEAIANNQASTSTSTLSATA